MTKRTCSVDGCEKPTKARDLCSKHYQRWRKHGDPIWQPPTPAARFWAKVNKNGPDGFHSQTGANLGPCWLWIAGRNSEGYGEFWVSGRDGPAHRFSYELLVGPIPDGLVPDHLCRVRHCVNPVHLEPVTNAENVRRGVHNSEATARYYAAKRAARTHCLRGHPASEYHRNLDGWYVCRECALESTRRRRRRKKLGAKP